jgi:Zn-dependent protease/predicted transcriptional regulator
MLKSYQVGTIYGIPFKVDVTFLLILPVFAGIIGAQIESIVPVLNSVFGVSIDPAPLTAGLRSWLLGFVAAVVLFLCVLLHELGHSAVALHYGYGVESITLWLLGGIAKPAENPTDWVREFWIAVAGPTVNVLIAGGCGLALLVVPSADVVVFLLLYLALLNVGLATFNMLPAFPLDGGRVLRALLARNRSYLKATRLAAAVGKAFALLLGVVGLFSVDFVLMAIALFVYIAATSETRQMMLDSAFEGVSIAEMMTPAEELETVEATLSLDAFLDVMLEDRHIGYPVLDRGTFVGIVTLEDVQSTDLPQATVADVMTPAEELETVHPSAEVMDALEQLESADVGRLPVVDSEGRLRGLVTRTDLMRAFKIVTEQERFTGEELRSQHPRER